MLKIYVNYTSLLVDSSIIGGDPRPWLLLHDEEELAVLVIDFLWNVLVRSVDCTDCCCKLQMQESDCDS